MAPENHGVMSGPSTSLQIKGLHVRYGKFQAVHGVDLTCGGGEIVSVIGANGAGKTSTLKAVIGQAGQLDGAITFAGHDLIGRSTAEIIRMGIALVPEGRWLFPTLTVEENLLIGKQVGRPGGPDLPAVLAMFPDLGDRRKQKARDLSGGQQQMVAIGRALLANPQILLCDEISLGLAPIVVQSLYAILPKIRDSGTGIVVVEQDIGRSLAIADRFYCLLEGRVTLAGRPADVSRDDVARHYFGS